MGFKSIADITGYIFMVWGLSIGAHTVLESLFRYNTFTMFLDLAPRAIAGISGDNELSVTLASRTYQKKPYEIWDVAFVYLLILSVMLFIQLGCWLFLILKMSSVVSISTSLLATWFLLNFLVCVIAASNQTALSLIMKDKRLRRIDTVKKHLKEKRSYTLNTFSKFFLKNWIQAPLETLKMLGIFLFIVVLYSPFWIMKLFRFDIDMDNRRTRIYYFTATAFVFSLFGASLSFIIGR